MRRPTMKDIADAAGVSRGAASFALNDRPGVSEETRARVKRVAKEMGWTPSPAALALSSRRARAVGLVIARPADSFASEGFFLRFISGVESVLQPLGLALVLQIVPDLEAELAVCRQWWAEGRVDGLLLVDPRPEDPRPELLAEVGLPGVVVGGSMRPPLLSGLATDDEGPMRAIVEHLAGQGHRRLAYVIGFGELNHTQDRSRSLRSAAEEIGVEVVESGVTGFTEDAGFRETEVLVGEDRRPTAIIYDNEILALGGLAAVHSLGLKSPDDVALVSCEDSPVCRVVQPPITALVRDPAALGVRATELLLDLVNGGEPTETREDTPQLVVRGSSSAG